MLCKNTKKKGFNGKEPHKINMAQINVVNICRLCLATTERVVPLNKQLTYIISTCFSLKIQISSQLPDKICQACVEQLKSIYDYRKNIIRNEFRLLKKSKKIINHSAKSDSLNDLQIDDAIVGNESEKSDVVDNSDEEFDEEKSNLVHEDFTIASDETQKNILDVKNDCDVIKENEQNLGMTVDNLRHNLKTDNDNFQDKLVKVHTVVNCSLINQSEIKANNLNATRRENSVDINVNNLASDQKSLSIDEKNEPVLEIDKENAFIITHTNNDFNLRENNDHVSEDVTFQQEKINTIDIHRKFMCLTCLKVFESQKELSIHYKTIELPKSVKETSKCKDSNNVVASKDDDGKAVFNCGVCSKVFDNKASALRHTQIHKGERPFQCNLCSRTYKTVADILRHGVVHNGFKFVCSYDCGYATVHLGALREHVKRHKKEFKYKCEQCGKCFQVKTWYEQHRNVHERVRPFRCTLCGQAFSMERYLTAHQANVHPQSSQLKRYKCAQCALPCDSRKTLVSHMKQKHGMKTECLCDVCGQILADQQKLIAHKHVHQASRRFSCRFCKKTFNKKDHQTVHEKIHTGDRLSCSSCPKSFTQRCSLRRHMKRYHQGDPQIEGQKL